MGYRLLPSRNLTLATFSNMPTLDLLLLPGQFSRWTSTPLWRSFIMNLTQWVKGYKVKPKVTYLNGLPVLSSHLKMAPYNSGL